MPDYSINDPKGWCGDPSRGAAIGRPAIKGEANYDGRLYVRRVRLNNGGYDRNGTYFGQGAPLYWVSSPDSDIDFMERGHGRDHVAVRVAARYPNAKIYGLKPNSKES